MAIINSFNFGIARKIVANMTTESWEAIPHGIVTYEPQVDGFLKVLKEINAGKDKSEKISINTAMLRICVEGIKAAPCMNSHIEFNSKLVRGTVKTFDNIDISMPVILKSGEMMTLNMHDFDKKNLREMRDAIAEQVRKANNSDMNETMYQVSLMYTLDGLKKGHIMQALRRLYGSKMPGKHRVTNLKGKAKKEYYAIPTTERLTRHDIEQGTITVTNLGSICRDWDGVCTMLEIIPPQTCAIAIASAIKKPVVNSEGEIVVATKMPLTIAFDHRAFDMGDIVPFINKLNEFFANPEILKEWY